MKRLKSLTILFCTAALLTGGCGPASATLAIGETYTPQIVPANFTNVIDNQYFPLTPGTKMIFEGDVADGHERIEVLVTDETREVMGVTCVVVRDTVWLNGEVIEDTYDWYAQDLDGNVWYFGEDVKDYDNGQVVSTAGSWEAGVDGALPGIVMHANPQAGVDYRQEYYAGEAEDMGKVISLDVAITVPYGSFEGCLVTEDWTPLEPGFIENKTYCPSIGTVRNEYVQGGSGSQDLIAIETE